MSSSPDALSKLSETSSAQKLFQSDCITLYKKLYFFQRKPSTLSLRYPTIREWSLDPANSSLDPANSSLDLVVADLSLGYQHIPHTEGLTSYT